MKLLSEIAQASSPEGPVREALELLLRAGAENPRLLTRARHDPMFRPISDSLHEALDLLDRRAADRWDAAQAVAVAGLEECRPWMPMADGAINEEFRSLEDQLDGTRGHADRGDPFARLEAGAQAEGVGEEAEALRTRSREQVSGAIIAALRHLSESVEEARPELKSTDEWVEARIASRECTESLEGLAEAEDAAARDLLEEVRHRVGLHADLLDVMIEEIERRERHRAEQREYKNTEDRAVLRAQREQFGRIHLQLGLTVFLAAVFCWAGPFIIFTAVPAVLAFLNAREVRAALTDRVWSIPRGDVDAALDELATRMIIAVLLVVSVGIVLVIQWMVANVG